MPTEPTQSATGPETPRLLSRSEHNISRRRIDENTLKVLYRLHRHGFKAYLVGGSIRDLLLNRDPKDFDVGTDATPQQVKKLFRNCFLVGRRFRLAHIRFGRDQVVEVATFRRHPSTDELPDDPQEHGFFIQNQFGTPREDAFRRDFTINALFYNIDDFSVIDHVGGLEDLKNRQLRVIGDPRTRFAEDPVRMLRALEFCARLDFSLDEATLSAITATSPQIAEAATARIREEVLELFRHGVGAEVLQQAQSLGMLQPMMGGYQPGKTTFALLRELNGYFRRIGKVEESMLLAALFLADFWDKCPVKDARPMNEVFESAGHLLAPFCSHFKLAHGLRHLARELLTGCYRFARGLGHRGQQRFLHNPQTAHALELFRLWIDASDGDRTLLATWEKALHTRHETARHPAREANRRTRRRPRRRRHRKPA